MNQNHKTLEALLKEELRHCAQNRWPMVCRMKETPQGYLHIKSYVLQMASEEAMSIGTSLALLESELNHNLNYDE